jgi:outer membrane protein OmpA-like peptidoglycan-associated protein
MTFRLLLAAAVVAPLLAAPAVAHADAHITITQVHELADALTSGGRIHRAVEFEYGRRRIYSKTREQLADIAKAVQARPDMTITVEGHAFARDEETSIALGESRADLVRALLIRYGVHPNKVTAVGASRIGEPGRYVDLVIERR